MVQKEDAARKRPQQRRSHFTVEAILEATEIVLKEEGLDRATTRRIAEKAGVSVGSLYQYFPNKDALLRELILQHKTNNLRYLEVGVEPHFQAANGEPQTSVASVIDDVIEHVLRSRLKEPELHRIFVAYESMHRVQAFIDIHAQGQKLIADFLQSRNVLSKAEAPLAAFFIDRTVYAVLHSHLLEYGPPVEISEMVQELRLLILRYLQLQPDD